MRIQPLAVIVIAAGVLALPASVGAGGQDTLIERACISNATTGHDADCAGGRGLANAAYLTVSPDGRFVYVTARDSDSIAAFARNSRTGALTQLPGAAGCLSDTGSGHDAACANASGLDRAAGVTISADGRFVYVAANYGDGVAIFSRDAATGALAQVGCIAVNNPACAKGTALDGAVFPALSPDGRNLYVAAADSNAVVVFDRDATTGALTERGCLTDATHPTTGCTKTPALDDPSGIALSADGRNVYVAAARSSAITSFARDPATGALTALGCISGDGGYRQDPACTGAIGLQFVQFVSVTADGKNVYVGATDSHTIVGFARNPSTGALTQLPLPDGCVKDFDNGDNPCAPGFGLALPLAVVPSPDGKYVYAASFGYGSVASFKRDPATGALSQFGPCISEGDARCDKGKGLNRAGFLALSPDGRNVYVNAPNSSAVAIFARSQPPIPPVIAGRRGKIVKRKAVRLKLICSSRAETGCFGSVRMSGLGRARRLRLGSVSFDIRRGSAAIILLPAKGRSRKLLRRLRRFDAKALTVTNEPGGDSERTSLVIHVRR